MSNDDKYTYPNSGGVLVNKRGLTGARQLDTAMNDLASAVWAALSTEPAPAKFDFAYLQRIHHLMFSRLFEWAGDVRDVDTVAGSTGIIYARPQFIESGLVEMFDLLASDETLLSLEDPAVFASKLSTHWGYLSQIHPFRDGNTRSQSLFVSNLARAAGHPIDWRLVNVDALRSARLHAMRSDEAPLADLIRQSITGEGRDPRLSAPVFAVDFSNSSGVAAPPLDGRCGKPRLNGDGLCRRRVGENGCPYHP